MQSQSAISTVIKHQSTDPLFNTPEAAEYLGVSQDTLSVWRCVGRYNIPFVKVGRLVRYRKSDLDSWLESRVRNNISAQ